MSKRNKNNGGFIKIIIFILLGIMILIGLFYLWLALTK